jgi:hypothetical protein
MYDPNWKIAKAKTAGSMIQVIECLPGKHKALCSNSNTDSNSNNKNSYIDHEHHVQEE